MDRVIVVNSDGMGSDDRELGGKLIGLFFVKLRMRDSLSDAVVFYNSGVKLLVKGSPVQGSMEGLLGDGVELLACGTCVQHYKLDESALVGRVGNMQEIANLLLSADSVITI